MDYDVDAGLGGESVAQGLEELSTRADGGLVDRFVVAVLEDSALTRPAVGDDRAVEGDVERELGRARDRRVEAHVETVDEDEQILLARTADLVTHPGEKRGLGQPLRVNRRQQPAG